MRVALLLRLAVVGDVDLAAEHGLDALLLRLLVSSTAPASEPWSVRLTAGISSSAARLARSGIRHAPSRIEYSLWTWRWTKGARRARTQSTRGSRRDSRPSLWHCYGVRRTLVAVVLAAAAVVAVGLGSTGRAAVTACAHLSGTFSLVPGQPRRGPRGLRPPCPERRPRVVRRARRARRAAPRHRRREAADARRTRDRRAAGQDDPPRRRRQHQGHGAVLSGRERDGRPRPRPVPAGGPHRPRHRERRHLRRRAPSRVPRLRARRASLPALPVSTRPPLLPSSALGRPRGPAPLLVKPQARATLRVMPGRVSRRTVVAVIVLCAVPWIVVAWKLHNAKPIAPPEARPTSVVWADRVFTSAHDLRAWLTSRGASYGAWVAAHPDQAAILEPTSVRRGHQAGDGTAGGVNQAPAARAAPRHSRDWARTARGDRDQRRRAPLLAGAARPRRRARARTRAHPARVGEPERRAARVVVRGSALGRRGSLRGPVHRLTGRGPTHLPALSPSGPRCI